MTMVLRRLDRLGREWEQVEDVAGARTRAEAPLARHPLNGADSFQLGAALLLVDDRPRRRPFVTADERLAVAADAEGFQVIVPDDSD